MANCCFADVMLMRDDAPFTDEDVLGITGALEKIDHCGAGAFDYQDSEILEWHGDTRWSLPEDLLVTIAATFNTNIRAIGREDGGGFVQVLCIDAEGVVVQDQAIEYAF